MKYERFEDVPVWRDAEDLAAELFAFTEDSTFRRQGDLANQMQRAGLSISNNIAEGFERGTTRELITFPYYSRGSAGEVRSMLCVMERMTIFNNLRSRISNLKSKADSISRQLRTWSGSLQESDIKGQRYLTDASRDSYARDQQTSAFMDKLKRDHEERINLLVQRRQAGAQPQ